MELSQIFCYQLQLFLIKSVNKVLEFVNRLCEYFRIFFSHDYETFLSNQHETILNNKHERDIYE